MAFRAQGLFEAAVCSQRQADYIESGGAALMCPYSYLDRGIGDGKLEFDARDGWLRIFSVDGGACLSFTIDRASALWMLLLAYLEITPDELRDLADSVERVPLSLDEIPVVGDDSDVRIFVFEDGRVYKRWRDDHERWGVFMQADSIEAALKGCARECWLGEALGPGVVRWHRTHVGGRLPDHRPFFRWLKKFRAEAEP
jgi:hypothetical protein